MSESQSEIEKGGGGLRKILTDAQVRRFERTQRIGRCQEIVIQIKTQHPHMEDAELDQLASELIDLLSKEKVAAKMAHFHSIDEEEAQGIIKKAREDAEIVEPQGRFVAGHHKPGLMEFFRANRKGGQ